MLISAADDYNPNLQKTDIIKGYGDGELHEEKRVTRAEALVMLSRAFGEFPTLVGNSLRIAIPRENFTDIPDWANEELSGVFDAGIVAGTGEGIFSPYEPVTRAEMELFIGRTFAVFGSNPKDSYYSTVNKKGLEELEIPAGWQVAGGIYDIDDRTNMQIQEIIKEASASEADKDTAKGKIKILYDCIMDTEARNAAGFSPIADDLEAIENIKSVSELGNVMLMNGTVSALSLLADFGLTIDSLDSGSYLILFIPASPKLPREVYEGKAPKQKDAFVKYVATLLKLCGESEEEAAKSASDFFDFQKQLSDVSLTVAEQYDLEKTYNIYTLEELDGLFSEVDLKSVFREAGFENGDRVLVNDEGNAKKLAEMITDGNLDSVKNYIKTVLIAKSSYYFGDDFRNAEITYSNEAYGIEGSMTMEEEASSLIAEHLGDYIGQVYAEKYCTEETVSDITEMIHDVIDIYKERIESLDWMSDTTKKKALSKLETLRICVGAPDYGTFESALDTAVFKSADEGGSYFDNMVEIMRATRSYDAMCSTEPVDKNMWITTPQTVNAFYFMSFNSITIPIAFLQSPIYDKNASYEENLGAIGFVIGHEITHAFDSSGSQYDENGNAVDWWTEEDKAEFLRLCEEVVSFFDGIEAAPGIAVNGSLTLTENIADLGAISCITSIGEKKENFDFAKMYEAYARMWLTTSSREALQMSAYDDVHSPSNVRVDRVLQCIDKFYEVYGITQSDGMWVAPQERVRIW